MATQQKNPYHHPLACPSLNVCMCALPSWLPPPFFCPLFDAIAEHVVMNLHPRPPSWCLWLLSEGTSWASHPNDSCNEMHIQKGTFGVSISYVPCDDALRWQWCVDKWVKDIKNSKYGYCNHPSPPRIHPRRPPACKYFWSLLSSCFLLPVLDAFQPVLINKKEIKKKIGDCVWWCEWWGCVMM